MAASLWALAAGSLGSSLATWLLAGRGAGNYAALAALATGRLLLDGALWLIASGLLGGVEALAARGAAADTVTATATGPADPGPAGPRPGATSVASWHLPLAVASAHRVWLAPAAAAARLARASLPLRLATWLGVGWLIYRLARERGHSSGAALGLLAGGLVLPVILLLGGLVLSGLGWLLSPLWPGGIPPFVPL